MKILLHACCGPCSTSCVKRLKEEGHDITLIFSNSNIYPKEEFDRRYQAAKKFATVMDLKLIKVDYDHNHWLEYVKKYFKEKEGGKRCSLCFEYNFKIISNYIKDYDAWTTTLTVSPHKNSKIIFEKAEQFPNFMTIDFKKQDGFLKSCKYSKQYDLYRQSYCGCEFSDNFDRSIASPKE